MESKLVEQLLQEATYNWEIDPIDRSWFISLTGEIWSEASHRFILKKNFIQDWERLKNQYDDYGIEDLMTNRLLMSGFTKIGELDNFYSVVQKLDDRRKDVLGDFCKSLLKVRPEVENTIMTITELSTKNEYKFTIGEISDDKLFSV